MLVFDTVKKHIDALDRMGFLDMGAPRNEYDSESRMIAERITKQSTPEEVAAIMAEVFSVQFNQSESKDTYAACAKAVCDELFG